MHEYSVVSSMLELCEKYAKESNAKKVNKVIIALGVQSGVEPELLKSAYDVFREGTICQSAELVVDIKEIVLKCKECSYDFEPLENSYICPKCDSIEIEVISGKEMHLMSLEME